MLEIFYSWFVITELCLYICGPEFICFREREARAAELAREIEGSVSSRSGIEMENGDEEEAFSAVVRPQSKLLNLKVSH